MAGIDHKRLATLAARAALAGVSRWALTREFTDLDAVERWLDLVTGKKATEATS